MRLAWSFKDINISSKTKEEEVNEYQRMSRRIDVFVLKVLLMKEGREARKPGRAESACMDESQSVFILSLTIEFLLLFLQSPIFHSADSLLAVHP